MNALYSEKQEYKRRSKKINQSVSQSVDKSVSASINLSVVSRKGLRCRALYLFAANQKTIKKKNISFSGSFVGMNFTKDSLCNVDGLKKNSLKIF